MIQTNHRFLLFLHLFFIPFLTSCQAEDYQKLSKTGYAMDTEVSITIFTKDSKKGSGILDQVFSLATKLEQKVSVTIDSSIISRLNDTKRLTISDKFVKDILVLSLELAQLTDGAFDPALRPIIKLWDFENSPAVPEPSLISSAIKQCSYKFVTIQGSTVTLINETEIDLGAIAKGAIVNQMAKFLKENNISDFLINSGGDIVISGLHGGNRRWNIAIADPFDNNNVMGLISLESTSIVTSGDYERFFIDTDGTRYHHIIDPANGYPAHSGVNSVTVITADAAQADALATALFVMGSEKGLKFVNSLDGVEAIYVSGTEKNKIVVISDGLKARQRKDKKWEFSMKEYLDKI